MAERPDPADAGLTLIAARIVSWAISASFNEKGGGNHICNASKERLRMAFVYIGNRVLTYRLKGLWRRNEHCEDPTHVAG